MRNERSGATTKQHNRGNLLVVSTRRVRVDDVDDDVIDDGAARSVGAYRVCVCVSVCARRRHALGICELEPSGGRRARVFNILFMCYRILWNKIARHRVSIFSPWSKNGDDNAAVATAPAHV